MKAIHNMKEALAFASKFRGRGGIFIFRDSHISMVNGGCTEIRFHDGEFYNYSYGYNWCDQQESPIMDIEKYIWKNRKSIKNGRWL